MRALFVLLLCILANAPTLRAVTFEAWVAGYSLSGASALADADPDFDRLSNLVEYALAGLNPTEPDSTSITSWGFAPALQGAFAEAETAPPAGAPLAWHHALVYQLRAGIEGVSVYPQLSHECPATGSGGDMLYWLGSGGRGDALVMVYTRDDGKLQAMSRARGHLQKRAFMRLQIERDGGIKMPVTEGAIVASLQFTQPLTFVPRVVGTQTTVSSTDRDLSYTDVTSPQTVYDVSWPYSLGNTGYSAGQVTRSASPAGILSPGGTAAAWTWESNGVVTLTLSTPARDYSRTVRTYDQSQSTARTITGSTAGSVRAHCVAQTDTRAAAFAGIAERHRLFSAWNPGTSYTRNTSAWVTGGTDIDMTPVSTWNDETAAFGNTWRGQTLVSPRHYIGAAHWAVGTGAVLHFITADNTLVSRTVAGTQVIAGTDIIVGVLDSDVPSSISFARILPDNWADYLPTLSVANVPVCKLDRGQNVWIADLAELRTDGFSGTNLRQPTLASRLPYYIDSANGDSGSPLFLAVNDKMVLLGSLNGGGFGGEGSFLTPYRAAINAAMSTLGGGYTLTDADLSGFTSY